MDREFNLINHFLALHNYTEDEHYDLILVLGNALPIVAREGYKLFLQNKADYFMIAGGRGHTTDILINQLKSYFNNIDISASEAEMLKQYLESLYGKNDKIILETQSTNCGENIKFAYRIIQEKQLNIKKVLLLHDPLMQRRIDATAKRYCADIQFFNYSCFEPKVIFINNNIQITNKDLWTTERYISLLLGEMKRIIDNDEGYGPMGKNYIVHVDVPPNVIMAYKKILSQYKQYLRQ